MKFFLFDLIIGDSAEAGSEDGAKKNPHQKYLFMKLMTDLIGNIVMIIRQAVLSPNPSLITVWHLLEESLVYSCLTPKRSFFFRAWMSLSWSLPLKLSSCFRLSHLHSKALSPAVAALHGLILAGRGWFILQKRKHSVLLLMNTHWRFFISLNQMYLVTLRVMDFFARPHTNLSHSASI